MKHRPSPQPGGRAATVIVSFLHRADSTSPLFHRSLRALLVRDAYAHPGRIVGEIDRECSANISSGRCGIVREFLERGADWLLMLDDDMTFAPELLDQLLAVADPDERPIVGGLCFGVRPMVDADGHDLFNARMAGPKEAFPTLYGLADDGQLVHYLTYPRDALVRVASTGAACLLIHRSVLADERWDDGHPFPWFRESVFHGKHCSEDHYFCLKAGSLGFPVHVHTGIKLGHVKVDVIDEDWYDAHRPGQ